MNISLSSITNAIGTAIKAISNFALTYGPKILSGINTVCTTIAVITQVVGVFKKDEKIEDMGDRALQASDAGIKPEHFDTFDEYLDAVRNFAINPTKSEKFTQVEKQLAGLSVAAKGIENTLDFRDGTIGDLCVQIAKNSDYFTEDRITSWLKSDLPLEKVIDYFDSKLNAADTIDIEEKLIQHEQTISGQDGNVIENELNQIREEIEQKS